MLIIVPRLQSAVEDLVDKGGELTDAQELLESTTAQHDYLEVAAEDPKHALHSLATR
jgi:hypothetical protein